MPVWAHLPSVVLIGHPTASPELRHGIAPSFFCRNRNKGKKRKRKMAHCCKCGNVCGTDYQTAFQTVGKNNYLCKACWERQRKDAADLMKGLGYFFVHLVLPVVGIVVIWSVCQVAVGIAHEKLGLSNEMCMYIWLGSSLVLSVPLVIKVFKTLWKMWDELHWFYKAFFCLLCPPLIILLIIGWVIKRCHKH